VASNKRERELARMRAERQAARRAAAEAARRKRRNQLVAILSALAVVAVVAVIGLVTREDDKDTVATPGASATPTASSTASTAASGGACSYADAGTPSKDVEGKPPASGPAARTATPVTLTTNRGEVVLSLDAAKAPCTVNSFTFLTGQKYFDGTDCHRLTTEGIYVLQCGDPTGTGTGGPGYGMPEENLTAFGQPNATGQVIYPRGTVAMARSSAPGSGGSQFFLVYKDSPLAPDYTPFGRITKGLELLDAVAAAGSTPAGDGKPNQGVTITRATVG
jgi:peptidyl-prolyl cis-trans isomerase B (cyclophilin B)